MLLTFPALLIVFFAGVYGVMVIGMGLKAAGLTGNLAGLFALLTPIVLGVLAYQLLCLKLGVMAVQAVDMTRSGGRVDLFAIAWRRRPNLLVLFGLVALIVLAVLVGAVVFLAPGVILALGMFPAPIVIILEDKGPRGSLARSWALTRGNRWRILQVFLPLLALLGLSAALQHLLRTAPVDSYEAILGIECLVSLIAGTAAPTLAVVVYRELVALQGVGEGDGSTGPSSPAA
jgi:hypothetical protein